MAILERMHLEIVKAVHEKGSLTAASEALCLTQSALSHSMKKLEDHLGVKVWYREGRNLKPTEAGKYLLTSALRIVPQMELIEERLRQFGRGERGTLKIGIECHPCYKWLLKVVEPFLSAWPKVNLDVRQEFQFGGLGALFNHEIDLLVTPDPLYKPGIHYEPVFNYEPVLAVGPEHILRNKKSVNPRQLLDETLYTYPVENERLDIFTNFLIPAGIQPRHHIKIETTEIMLKLVSCGRGVAALPRWIVEEYSSEYQVFPVCFDNEKVTKQIHIGIRDNDIETDYIQSFITLAHHVKSLGSTQKLGAQDTLVKAGT